MNRQSILVLTLLLGIVFLIQSRGQPPLRAASNAVFTVNSTLDEPDVNPGDGICNSTFSSQAVCTLRAAIQETNALPGADTIILPGGIYTLTLLGANEDNAATGDLDIKDDLIIVGAGADTTIIDGNGTDRVFDIFGAIEVAMTGITIRNGYPGSGPSGGGIRINPSVNAGTTRLEHVSIVSNDSDRGGGIYNAGVLYLNDSSFSDNGSYWGGGAVHNVGALFLNRDHLERNNGVIRGGALLNYGYTSVTNSTFTKNRASLGGAIYSQAAGLSGLPTQTCHIYPDNGNLVLEDVTISNNIADEGGGIWNADGWASISRSIIISNTGSGIFTQAGCVNVDQSDIISNTTSSWYGGGGIYNLGGTLVVNYSRVLSNTAPNGSGGGIVSRMDKSPTPTTILRNVSVSGNRAYVVGGVLNQGILTATDSHFDRNVAGGNTPNGEVGFGTIVDGNDASMVLARVTINYNDAPYWTGLLNAGYLTVTESTIDYNVAHSFYGDLGGFLNGCIAYLDSVKVIGNSARNDAGVWNGGYLTMMNSNVSDNHATYEGGGIYSAPEAAFPPPPMLAGRADIFAPNDYCVTVTQSPEPIRLNLSHVIISNNTAAGSAGLGNGGLASLDQVTIISNTASYGAGVRNAKIMTITNSAIVSNTALHDGGGLFNSSESNPGLQSIAQTTATNVTFSGNQALKGRGGGIFSVHYPDRPYTSTLSLLNVTLSNNSAITGSNISILTSTVQVKNTIIANGIAGSNCYILTGTLTSLGHNLEDADTCGLTATGDLTNTNPLLGPLQDNGGATLTHALMPGSPAIDAGDNTGCPVTDQRGIHRPFGHACDIGAFELQYPFWLPILFGSGP